MNKLISVLLVLVGFCSGQHYYSTMDIRDIHYNSQDSKVYLATSGGLVYGDGNDSWECFNHLDGLPTNELTQVSIDKDGIVWTIGNIRKSNFSIIDEICITGIDISAKQVIYSKKYPDHYYEKLYLDSNVTWIMSNNIIKIDENQKETIIVPKQGYSSYFVGRDETGSFWSVNNSGFTTFKDSVWEFFSHPSLFLTGGINSFAVLSAKALIISYFSKENFGTYLVVRDGDSLVWSKTDSLTTQFYVDSRGTVFMQDSRVGYFLCSFVEGKLNLTPALREEGSPGIHPMMCVETHPTEDKIWTGDHRGLGFYQDNTFTFKEKSCAGTVDWAFNGVKTLTVDNSGLVWIIESMERFFKSFRQLTNTWSVEDNKLNGITSATIRDVKTDSDGNFWVVSNNETAVKRSNGDWTTYHGKGGSSVNTTLEGWTWVFGVDSTIQGYSKVAKRNIICQFAPVSICPISEDEMYALAPDNSLWYYSFTIWEKLNFNCNKIISMVAIEREVFIATEKGVYSSTDNNTWNLSPVNNPNGLNCSELYCLSISPNNILYVSTVLDVFLLKNYKWEKCPDKPVSPVLTDIVFDKKSKLVWYVGKQGLSCFPWEDQTVIKPTLNNGLIKTKLSVYSDNIRFDLDKTGMVSLKIYDLRGRIVATPINCNKNAGKHSVSLRSMNIGRGTYICVLQTSNLEQVKKIKFL